MNSILDTLRQQFPQFQFQSEFDLAPLTTVKIGGPAEVFCEVKNRDEFIELVSFCQKEEIPLTVLGWGANTLIADRGIRGLVVRYTSQQIQIKSEFAQSNYTSVTEARWKFSNENQIEEEEYPEFNKVDYTEDDKPKVEVEIEAGVPLPFAISSLLQEGITGLQWFSRIPATIGGAIYNNIHGGTHFMSEYVQSVLIIDEHGEVKTLTGDQLEFQYDYSRFHHTKEVIISAVFSLYKGDADKARQVVSAWAIQKKNQPQNSLGCVFQNISEQDQKQLQYPTPSVGYIVDKILGKKGFRIGDAKISEKHAAFIENLGSATAADYLAVIKTVITEIKEKTGLEIKPEIFFKGFRPEELAFLN